MLYDNALLRFITPYFCYGVNCIYFDSEKKGTKVCKITQLNKDKLVIMSDERDYTIHIQYVNLSLYLLSNIFTYKEVFKSLLNKLSESDLKNLANCIKYPCKDELDLVSYSSVRLLIENHFDIHDLISNGYAIDINTLR